jgi:hypothetical protein
MRKRNRVVRLAVATAVGAALAACTEGLGTGTGEVRVTLAEAAGSGAAAAFGGSVVFDGAAALLGSIPRDTVASLTVTVTSIQFLREGADSADDSPGWISLDLGAPVTLDLVALPSEGVSPLVIAAGSVEAGTYTMVRLFVSSASIRLKGDVTIGQAIALQGGVDYPVTIPSGAQTGIKTDVSFTVEAGSDGTATDVGLLFDASTTFANVTATGAGSVILAPVLRAR